MFRKRKLIKAISIFFLLEMLFDLGHPIVSYALTAGPTAPEYTSFEPVDTTDMVNMLNGDFVYNMPILEVPGPGGGYPLSLSYHGGIKHNQESSWVGLGWNINPGAINRSVQGFADDANDVEYKTLDYSDGGERTTDTYNLALGGKLAGDVSSSLNFSLSTTSDTYEGVSRSFSVSSGAGYTFGESPVSPRASLSNGITVSDGKVSAYRSVSVGNRFAGSLSTGASISSNGLKSFARSSADIAPKNSSAGRISSYTSVENKSGGFGGKPLTVVLDVTKKYTRYWSSETAVMKTYGSLYPRNANNDLDQDRLENNVLITHSGDVYHLYDDVINEAAAENNPELQIGGSFLNYDSYQVLGQGISGMIEPYVAENGDLFGQSYYAASLLSGIPSINNPLMQYQTLGTQFEIDKVDFRFLGDYSNRVDIDAADILSDASNVFRTTEHNVTGHNDGLRLSGKEQRIAGSRGIQWFTNEEIVSGSAKAQGFMDFYQDPSDRQLDYEVYENYLQPEASLSYCLNNFQSPFDSEHNEASFVGDQYCDTDVLINCPGDFYYKSLKPKNYDLREKIGGFKVTNESGVTYHYALPVYNYNEYSRTRIKETRENVAEHRENFNRAPYAYTWLLTAVTGPDFVDRNTNGVLDDDDWGYWVKFDYGMWTDSYQWRTPHQGYAQDINADVMTFTYGMKELYYLDAIETKSHIALFAKSKRKDGYGVTSRLEGGSNPREYNFTYPDRTDRFQDLGSLRYYVAPVATMKLDAIYLLDKDDYSQINIDKAAGDKYNDGPHAYPYEGAEVDVPTGPNIREGEDFVYVKYHNGDQVLDDGDIDGILGGNNGLEASSLRIVDFNYDYSLADGVPNSIAHYSDFGNTSTPPDPLCFPKGYDIPVPNDLRISSPPCGVGVYEMYGENSTYLFDLVNQGCETGDGLLLNGGADVRFERTGKLTLKSVDVLGKRGESVVPPYAFEYGNNPDYQTNYYDEWGYYKDDFSGSSVPANIAANRDNDGRLVVFPNPTDEQKAVLPYSREVTENSADNLDAWSLTRITSPLGAEINVEYEADEYTSVLNSGQQYEIGEMEKSTTLNQVILTLKEKSSVLMQRLTPGVSVDLKALTMEELSSGMARHQTLDDQLGTVVSLNDDRIIVSHPTLYQLLSERTVNISGSNVNAIPHFVSAFIKTDPVIHKGGGVRVNKISVLDGFSGRESWTTYNYNDVVTGQTSGVSSYKPYNAINVSYDVHNDYFYNSLKDTNTDVLRVFDEARSSFQNKANEANEKVMANITEIPVGVYYGTVTVQNGVNDFEADFKNRYQHTVFSEDMVQKEREITNTLAGNRSAKLELKNYTHRIGNLEKHERINQAGEVVYRTTNNYLLDTETSTFEEVLKDQKQGVIEQSAHKHFRRNKFYVTDYEPPYDFESVYDYHRALVTKKSDYVDILTETVEEDLKRGVTTRTSFLAFDFFSGQTTKTLVEDSYGNQLVSETIPAYHKYPGMGLALNGGANMLTQEAENIEFAYSVLPLDNPISIDLYPNPASAWVIQVNREGLAVGDHIKFILNGQEFVAKTTGQFGAANDHFYIQMDGRAPTITTAQIGVPIQRIRKSLVSATAQTWNSNSKILGQPLLDQVALTFSANATPDQILWYADDYDKLNKLEVGERFKFSYFNAPILGRVLSFQDNGSYWRYEVRLSQDIASGVSRNSEILGSFRQHRSYQYLGDNIDLTTQPDGLYPFNSFERFDSWEAGQEPISEQWQKNSEVTLYDIYSQPLEAKDINGNYAATKMDIRREQVYTTVANAEYNEFAYSGAEDTPVDGYFGGGVKLEGEWVEGYGHTGIHFVQSRDATSKGFSYKIENPSSEKYLVSFWTTSRNSAIKYRETRNDNSLGSISFAELLPRKWVQVSDSEEDRWYLLRGYITVSADNLNEIEIWTEGSGITLQDDFRVHPVDAVMTSYVYNQWGELTHILDANNVYTEYRYDGVGRLTEVWRETFDRDLDGHYDGRVRLSSQEIIYSRNNGQ
ncbi:MAG: RHS repeat domain-containing protein [Bacteroidota bacterium]